MNERETYGGIVIPKAFSKQLASLQTDAPTQSTLQLYINEGANPALATSIQTILEKISTQLNTTLSAQIAVKLQQETDAASKQVATQLESMLQMLPAAAAPQAENTFKTLPTMISLVQPKSIAILAQPVTTELLKVNAAGKLTSTPTALFTPVWVGSLLGAAMLYLALSKRSFAETRTMRKFQAIQSLIPIVYGLFAGFIITWFTTWILGYEFDSFLQIALFVSLAVTAFCYMMLATIKWLKLPSAVLFALLIFFGLPLIQVVPEMVPHFYSAYILPWLPMKFLIEGLKELLFFDNSFMNHNTNVLIGITIVSFIVIWLKNVVTKKNAA
ncbi:YhgE/Pip domain-containing protein [Kurthia senegalensis]|uniref:YhgE/Pip domain-containing protein n=1 Tax=Kurthia senegalensis TaxID=1033740 RepID=UPI000313219C|nr:hypothetical protein [Kurthia senegalensis]